MTKYRFEFRVYNWITIVACFIVTVGLMLITAKKLGVTEGLWLDDLDKNNLVVYMFYISTGWQLCARYIQLVTARHKNRARSRF